ncbi:MAG: DUF2961 domain-containing protein [Candidatus Omnitrophota bacterium]|nr:MAG: DUF2961 domain-containing protein [Candidatus Omnitrophota bacterium]
MLITLPVFSQTSSLLENLARAPNFESHRVSSYDLTGGNADRLSIKPGETKILAEIEGPAAITHIWNTIAAEKYYSRMLILRFYWDGQDIPSVEAPIGDFFGVGHGLDRPFASFPVAVSSEGRARNCYWFMPFQKSAIVTVTHEGFEEVYAFYYYIDYRKYESLPADSLYFHAQYRQVTPNPKVELAGKNLDGKTNYLLMETNGKGLYVGTVQSVQTNNDGWYGEGDDMFFVDGAETPTMTGTGTEDYFNDAWGFREFCFPYHGVTLWEGYKKRDRGTAYKWHIFDPIAFKQSLRATIEHGHANDRQDDFYTVSFWYQTLPGPEPPVMANVMERLPDEGQLYAKRIFINKELSLHLHEERFMESLDRIEQFVSENEGADDYGYWSMRRGFLEKMSNNLPLANEAFSSALEKSKKEDRKSQERDAEQIRRVCEKEHAVLDDKRKAWIYALADDQYEIFLDGKSVATGGGGDRLGIHEIEFRGAHMIAVKCENKSGRAGFAFQLSHHRGLTISDSSWLVSSTEQEGWNQRKFDDSTWIKSKENGFLDDSRWQSSHQPFAFYVPLLSCKVIWTPEGEKSDQTVFFRKEIRIR